MTTVINNPQGGDGSNSAVGMIVGVIVLIVVVILFFVFALPAIRGSGAPQGAQQEAPKNDAIDVNVTIPTNEEAPAEGTGN